MPKENKVELVEKLYDLFKAIRNVDEFTRKTGAIATVFKRVGDDFVRISTTSKAEDGTNAINTRLDRSSDVYKALIRNKVFVGETKLFGKLTFAKYAPFFWDDENCVLLALAVAVPIKYKCKCH